MASARTGERYLHSKIRKSWLIQPQEVDGHIFLVRTSKRLRVARWNVNVARRSLYLLSASERRLRISFQIHAITAFIELAPGRSVLAHPTLSRLGRAARFRQDTVTAHSRTRHIILSRQTESSRNLVVQNARTNAMQPQRQSTAMQAIAQAMASRGNMLRAYAPRVSWH